MSFRLCIPILALLCGAALGAGSGVPPATKLRIAVVDIDRVFTDYALSKDLKADLQRLRERYRRRLSRIEREIGVIQASMEEFSIGTHRYEALKQKLQDKVKAFRILRLKARRDEQATNADMIRRTYRNASEEIASYARAHHIDLVIKQREAPKYDKDELKKDSPETAVLDIARRTLLYYHPRFDITDAIVKRLNQAYDKKKASRATDKGAKGAKR